MKISELRSKPHISVSSVNAYVNCGLQYKFRRIDRLPPESISDNLVFGSAVHKCLADFNQEKMTGNKLALKELQDIFEKYWRADAEDNKWIGYSTGKDFKKLLSEGKNLLKAFYRELPREGFTILSIEEPFRFNIDGIDVPMIGVMVLVEQDIEGTIVITEYKAAAKAFSINQTERLFQLTIYYMAAKRNGFGDREIVLKIDSLINAPNRYMGKKIMPELEDYAQHETHLYDALKKKPVAVPYLKHNIREFTKLVDSLMQRKDTTEPTEMIMMLRESLDYDLWIS